MMEAVLERQHAKSHVSEPRIDARERVMGLAKYTADWHVKDMLYARIFTSTVPHGIVKNIDSSEAAKTPGFVDMVSCLEDSTVWEAGEREHDRRVFADHVRFVGDCIGAVTATTRIAAKKAASLVSVQYEELPASFNIDSTLGNSNLKIWDNGNTIGPLKFEYGDAEEEFRNSQVVMERHYSTSRLHNVPLEPAISLAWWDGDNLTVVAATQSVHGCRNGIAKDLGLLPEKVRVIGYYKGGGFGNKINSMNYDLIAAICSRRTGKPVMVEYSREDEFINVHGRWSTDQDLRIAADRDGRINAVEVKANCDIGAYTRHMKRGHFIEGPEHYYSTEAWNAEIYGVYTNTPATGHMRAPPGPQSAFSVESLVDEMAYELGMDPVEMRFKNYIRHPHSGKFTSNGFEECITRGAEEFGWKQRWKRPEKQNTRRGLVTGVGVAIGSWHSGLGHGEAIVSIDSTGVLEVNTGVVDIGTGAKTTMALIASGEAGIPFSDTRVIWGDTETSPFSVGESGSRTTGFTGTAVREAARQIRSDLLSIGEKVHGISSSKLEIKEGNLIHSGNGNVISSVRELMHASGNGRITKSVTTEPALKEGEERFVFAAHFAEVAVDLETGEVKLTDYLAYHDSGEIVNRLTAESQVQGGIVMGIGMALTEKLLISKTDGSIENPSLLLYRIPNMAQIPKIKVFFTDTIDPYGPKSLGEIPIIPVTAAIGNAIFNATGVRLRNLPFSREELLRELKGKK